MVTEKMFHLNICYEGDSQEDTLSQSNISRHCLVCSETLDLK